MAEEYIGTCDGCGIVAPLAEWPMHSIDDYQELCERCVKAYDEGDEQAERCDADHPTAEMLHAAQPYRPKR